MAFTAEELDFLFAHPEAIEAGRALALSKASLMQDVATLRGEFGEFARAIVELVSARRVMEAKTGLVDTWVDTAAAQQATHAQLGMYRALMFQAMGARRIADVTCSVGTELMLLHQSMAAFPHVLSQLQGVECWASDLDPQRVRLAQENLHAFNVPVQLADATQPDELVQQSADLVVLADPARRNSSGLIARLEDLLPPPSVLADLYPRLVMKLAPGVNPSDVDAWAGLVDYVSVDGAMKEACAYSHRVVEDLRAGREAAASDLGVGLGERGVVRRAICISGGQVTVWHHELPQRGEVGAAGRFILEPDPAVIRAGLVQHYATAHGLWQLDPHIAFLTGDRVPAGVRGFEVIERVSLKHVKAALKQLDAGAVEILVRGVDVDPDVLRKQWKLRGREQVSVIITRLGDGEPRAAFLCRPAVVG